MFAALGILLLVGGAILTFAIDRQPDGVDLVAIGWILMAGAGISLVVAMIRAAGPSSMSNTIVPDRHRSDEARHVEEPSKR